MRYTAKRHYAWGTNLAYLTGLIASDGCLINDGRHITITSKDIEVINYAQRILDIHSKIKIKYGQRGTCAYDFQFSNVALYDFLLGNGITP